MSCTNPISAYRLQNGSVSFIERGNIIEYLKLPCARCKSCLMGRGNEWSLRIMQEAKLHDRSSFLTLTYSDENLPDPPSLNHKHFQDFLKRLRFKYKNQQISYLMCGEYGSTTRRPHYHVALFGMDWHNIDRYWSGGDLLKAPLYTSDDLNKLWGLGECKIGNLTAASATYICRYILDKKYINNFSPENIKNWYKYTDSDGVIHDLLSEYIQMSKRPAIGKRYFEKYKDDIYATDSVISNGHQVKVPRYYDKLFKKISSQEKTDSFENTKFDRMSKARENFISDDEDKKLREQKDIWLNTQPLNPVGQRKF